MAEGIWLVAAILAVGVLQVVAYRYLAGREAASPREARAVEEWGYDPRLAGTRADHGEEGSEPGRRCRACGAVNDPAYTYCRRCVGRLGGTTI